MFIINKDMIRVICDTNVWYRIGTGHLVPPSEATLIPTAFTLNEIATSTRSVEDPISVKKAIGAIYNFGGEIIPVNPFDYVLSNQSSRFSNWDIQPIKKILISFSEMLSIEFDESTPIPSSLIPKVRKESDKSRAYAEMFSQHSTKLIQTIRKNINKTTGIKVHLGENVELQTKEFLHSFLNSYLKLKNDSIEFSHIDWKQFELFLVTTENFFKKLETTRNMKFHANDITDWLNMLYVRPGEKYLTFDDRWKKLILRDERVRHYLFKCPI